MIDGKNKSEFKKNPQSQKALDKILKIFKTFPVKRLDVLGNHEFYNFDREYWIKNCNLGRDGYYSYEPVKRWRLIVLDTFDISVISRKKTTEQ
eukprot:UN25772